MPRWSRFCLLAVLLALPLLLVAAPRADEERKAPSAEEALRQRLKKHEDEVARLREVMLKECDDEIRKADEALKKARKDMEDTRAGNDARRKAIETMTKAQQDKFRLSAVRSDIERRVQPYTPPRPIKRPPKPAEQRLGIQTSPVSTVVSKQLGMEKDQGVVVDSVSTGSPAAKAGLQRYDILLKFDGKAVPASGSSFRKLLGEIKPDTPVEAVVLRGGKQETVKGVVIPADENQTTETKDKPKASVDVPPKDAAPKDKPKEPAPKDAPARDKQAEPGPKDKKGPEKTEPKPDPDKKPDKPSDK
jgi:C-terminal processing protease CtpA/Prc